jgi:CheY-like chemotaxis protein
VVATSSKLPALPAINANTAIDTASATTTTVSPNAVASAAPAVAPISFAMTASARNGDQVACLAAGMYGHISQPLKTEALCEMLVVHCGDVGMKSSGGTPAVASLSLTGQHAVAFDYSHARDTSDKEVVMLIATHFLQQAPSQINDMHGARQTLDMPTLRRIVYPLVGLFTNFRAQPLISVCQRIERSAASGRSEDVGVFFSHIDQIYLVCSHALREWSEAVTQSLVPA